MVNELIESKKQNNLKTVTVRSNLQFLLIVVFILALILLVFMPKISDVLNKTELISQKQESIQQLESKFDTFSKIDINDTNNLLNTIRAIAPTDDTDITVFQEKIRGLISTLPEVQIVSLRVSDDEISSIENMNAVRLREVPVNLEIVGIKSLLEKFLTDVSTSGDFITVEQLSMVSLENDSRWKLNARLVKSQFIESTNSSEIYRRVSPSANVDEVIRQKIININLIN